MHETGRIIRPVSCIEPHMELKTQQAGRTIAGGDW